ncbi:hypothetical protein [Mariniplasma anaerobium]|uniref:DUF998 domain-containing protein n=1 Tax=Mariniplasma anaerobium TaxID=2735436 RepID=A0A7U9TJG7_9MOLU|nr:hypothetical protein [Mariniplasma anaerobium]BCR36200.1 hypothetical protein MPAN_010930 [Mariniplasma anaerobium]
MNKRVYNSTFGKIVRTLGFLLVLVSSLYISTYLIIQNDTLPFVSSLLPFAQQLEGIIDTLPAFIADYIGLFLVVGLILLTWAIRKGIILRVLITVVLLFGYLESAINSSSSLVPITLTNPSWMSTVLNLVDSFYISIIGLSEFVIPGVMVAAPMFLWALFANKKPGRFSVLMMRLGSIALFLAILSLVLGDLFLTTLALQNWYMTVQIALYMVTYLLFVVGGVFGFIGFSRK